VRYGVGECHDGNVDSDYVIILGSEVRSNMNTKNVSKNKLIN